MTIYSIEKDPNVYITPIHQGNKFMYRMATFVKQSYTRKVICNIDLRNDKLIIHGTEIKEPMLQKLYESLTLGVGPKMGHIYVNCNGACYFFVTGKGIYRPIHNVIFDWSNFEVIVPNSLSDSLRNELEKRQLIIDQSNAQLSSATDEAVSAKASLEETRKNASEIECELSSCRKENDDMLKELMKLQEELLKTKNELEATKIMLLESSEKVEKVKGDDEKKAELQFNKVEMLSKISNCIDSVKSRVKLANQKLDQALTSQLWIQNRDDSLDSIAIEGVNV